MPAHANKTSFQPGHKRTPESIEKQRATLKARGRPAHWDISWTEERIARRSATVRAKAVGNRRVVTRHKRQYWQVMTAEGPRYEHRVVMEEALGRKLLRSEHVHHINHDGLDNRLENLELLNHAEHMTAELTLPAGRWTRRWNACTACGGTSRRHAGNGLCKRCYQLTPEWRAYHAAWARARRAR